MSAFAVIKTGGKQYRVAPDDLIVVEKLPGDAGDPVVFDQVLMLGDGASIAVGAPLVAGAVVTGTVAEQRKADKITIIKMRRRKTYRRKRGHRQLETVVAIGEIRADGAPAPKAKAKAKAKPAEPDAEAMAAAAVKFLDAPDGAADDLKMIGGVGPKLEEKLHGLGIYHWRQIAAFTDEDVAKVDAALNFKGRITREDWLSQAKDLMEGKPPRAAVDKAAKKAQEKKDDGSEPPNEG